MIPNDKDEKTWIQKFGLKDMLIKINLDKKMFGFNKFWIPKNVGSKEYPDMDSGGITDMDKCPHDKCCLNKCQLDSWNLF